MNFRASLIVFFFVCQGSAYAQISLFSFGSTWKYKDDGSNQGTAWSASSFNDSGWANGVGQLGFGDGDESTVLTSGAITYYFRKSVTIADISQFQSFTIEIYRDDGAVIY